MDFAAWFRHWLQRHPLRTPPEREPAEFTARVMSQIRPAPAEARRPAAHWKLWPGLALTCASAAAGLALAVWISGPSTRPMLARAPSPAGPLTVVAEAPPDGEEWIAQTLELLQQLDEELPEDPAEAPSDQDWIKELQMLDDEELASS
jgi:hypothetical protein